MKRALPETRRWTSGDLAARLSQAEVIANMLDANGFSAATAADFGFGQWHMAALIAQVNDPSSETQAIVVRMLQDKEAACAAAELGISDSSRGHGFDRQRSCPDQRWGIRGESLSVRCFRCVARGLPRSIVTGRQGRQKCRAQVISAVTTSNARGLTPKSPETNFMRTALVSLCLSLAAGITIMAADGNGPRLLKDHSLVSRPSQTRPPIDGCVDPGGCEHDACAGDRNGLLGSQRARAGAGQFSRVRRH